MMRERILLLILVGLIFSGCALKVVPDPGTLGTINPKENSLSLTKDSVEITVKLDQADLSSYNIDGTIAAFDVEIENRGTNEISFGQDDFLLLDNENRQYYSLSPEKIKEMIAKDSYYLLPYPYVGFYYLEEYEKASYQNTVNSNLPYYYELHPQDIFSKALNAGSIIPKAKVSGLVYFRVDLHALKGVRLLVYKKGAPKSATPDFTFPFSIVK